MGELLKNISRKIRQRGVYPGELPDEWHYLGKGTVVETDLVHQAYRVVSTKHIKTKLHTLEGTIDVTGYITMPAGEYSVVTTTEYGNWVKTIRKTRGGQTETGYMCDVGILRPKDPSDKNVYALISPNMVA